MSDWAARRHRTLYWTAVLVSLLAFGAGSVLAYVSYAQTAGPDGAVKGYFAALQRKNAPAALGFGDLPTGPRTLLTSTVLREQQRLAAIRDVQVVATERTGDTATVTVRYRLDFQAGSEEVSDQVRVVRRAGSWRLTATAAATQLNLSQAADRATIVGAAVPGQPLLLFPGAVPIRFDSTYLALDPATSSVRFSTGPITDVNVIVSSQATQAVDAAVSRALVSCLKGAPSADPRCPLPSPRAVPGTLHGALTATNVQRLSLSVVVDRRGVIDISARVPVTGRYTALNFNNLPVTRQGPFTLPVHAQALAVAPLTVIWTDPQS